MKKILFLILLITNVCAYSQTYIRNQLKWVRVGGVWQLQIDSASNNNWRAFATREYVQGYVFSHPPTVNNLSDIPNRPFSALQSIPTTIAGYGISDAANKSTTMTASFGLIGGGDLSTNRDFKVDTTHSSIGISTYLYLRHISDSLANLISAAGGGTVLSVGRTNGYGILASVADPSVNPNITIGIDSATLALYFQRRKDSSVAGGYYPYSSNPKGYLVSSDVSGTYVPLTRTVNGKALSSNITLGLASSDFANQGTTTTVLHGNASGGLNFGQIVNADVSASAAIGYSKLNLTGSIVNADISSSAAIPYSKLNLAGSILNGDIVNGTIDLNSKVTGNLAISHFNSGTNAASNTWWNGVGIWDTLPNITFNVQSPLYPLNDSTIAIRIVSSSDTGVVTPAMKTLWDGKISGLAVGTTTIASGTSGRILYDNAGVLGEYPIGTGVATFIATPSSANLASAITDETGSGALVFGTSPDFTTGITIGSVAVPTISSTNTFTNKRWTARVGSTTSSATPTINTDNVDIYKLTAQAAAISSFTTNLSGTPNDGDVLEIQITDNGTARAITWGSSFVASTVALPTTTVISTTLTTIFQYYTTSSYGNNKWVCVNSY